MDKTPCNTRLLLLLLLLPLLLMIIFCNDIDDGHDLIVPSAAEDNDDSDHDFNDNNDENDERDMALNSPQHFLHHHVC